MSVLVTREKTPGITVRYGERLFAVTFEMINTRKIVRQGETVTLDSISERST